MNTATVCLSTSFTSFAEPTLTMVIPDKATFKRLSMANQLGNRFRAFDTVEAAQASGIEWFYIRGPIAQWPYMVPWCLTGKLEMTVHSIEQRGAQRADMQFVEVQPRGAYRSINAEAVRDGRWLTMTYGTSCELSLRDDIWRNGVHLAGLRAWLTVKHLVPPEDVEMLCEIWDEYPDATIEFSTWPRWHVGVMKRNTVIWEVRNY